MSLILAVKAFDGGIVLSGDGRAVIIDPTRPGWYATDDTDVKVHGFPDPHQYVGVATVGLAMTYATLFAHALPPQRRTIRQYAEYITEACVQQYATRDRAVCTQDNGGPIIALVAGIDEGADAGRLFAVHVPGAPEPVELHAGATGIAYAGTRTLLDRLLNGYVTELADMGLLRDLCAEPAIHNAVRLKLPLHELPLTGCIALSKFLIQFVIDLQRFQYGQPWNVGGAVDIATITAREGFRFVQCKEPNTQPSSLTWRRSGPWPRLTVTVNTPSDSAQVATYTIRPQ